MESPGIARELMRRGADVHVVMTSSAQALIRPALFEWATGNPVVVELTGKTEHIQLAGDWRGRVDLVLVAPCTANTLSKFAIGVDDTPVTSVLSCALGSAIPILIAPAMHEPMMRNRFVLESLERVRAAGIEILEPRVEEGKAKIAPVEEIVEAVVRQLGKRDLKGLRVLATSGPTVEHIDPVRIITNPSSGRMGIALAEEASRRGAQVTLIAGPGRVEPPGWMRVVRVQSTREMADAMKEGLKAGGIDLVMMAAAPADFAPSKPLREKVSTRSQRSIELTLEATPKIVEIVKQGSPGTFLLAFKAEHGVTPEELLRRAKTLQEESGADLVAGNLVDQEVGFGSEANEVYLVSKDGSVTHLERASKSLIARRILDQVSLALGREDPRS